MKSKLSLSTKNFFPRKIAFNNLLNSEYFFHRSVPIKLALNRDRVLKRDFFIERAHAQVDQGRKPKKDENDNINDSDDYRRNKSRVPADLQKIILKYDKKFEKQNQKFYKSKSNNDMFTSHWHSVNDLSEKKERQLMLEKYFNDKDKNSINYHTKEIKKMCENMFKTSPLLNGKKYLDIFFYYLNEFKNNFNDIKKMEYIKKKIIKFLVKLNNYVDFVEVLQDSALDSITKDVKIKNSKYKREYEAKVRMEELKNAILQRKEDKKNIKESDIIIQTTLKTINDLDKNKNLFDDVLIPLDINSKIEKSRNFLSPNKTPYSTRNKFHISENKKTKMNSTQSTAFYLSEKGFLAKNKNNKIFTNINNIKQNDTQEEDKLESEIKNDKLKLDEIKPKKINLNKFSDSIEENESKTNSINSLQIINKPSKKIENRYALKYLTNIKPKILSKIDQDKLKNLTKNLTSKNIVNITKNNKISFQSQLSNVKDLSSKGQFENIKEKNSIQKKVNFNLNDNLNKLMNAKNLISKSNSQLYLLYEDIRKRKKIQETNDEDLKKYFVKKGRLDESMDLLKKVYTMDIISKTKIISDKIDIEQKTKKVFQTFLSYEQEKKLEGVKEINRKVKGLDNEYINRIIKYKTNKNE